MLSGIPRRRRRTRAAAIALCAATALAVTAALAPATPAAVRSNVRLALSGTHTFGTFGVYDATRRRVDHVDGRPGCTVVQPLGPCRTITIATVASAVQGPITCGYTGATTATVPRTDTTTVDAVVVPPNPIVPPTRSSRRTRCARSSGRSRSATASPSRPTTRSRPRPRKPIL